jgi:hypothetical protein
MANTLNKYEMIEVGFSSTLTRFLMFFNMLETNVGLCISFLVNHTDPKASYPFLNRLNAQGKMDVLKELVTYKGLTAEEQFTADFNEWFKLASQTRVARNRYVHGYWDVMPHVEKPIRFHPTDWTSKMSGEKKDKAAVQEMNLDEFKAIADEMESVFEKFGSLRKKYGV